MKQRILRCVVFLFILIALDWIISLFFQKGMERYYGLHQEADILIIGHSHLMKTCNKNKMEKGLGLKISKYCREGVMIRERLCMIQHFLNSQQDSSVPIVLYGVDPSMFSEGQLSHNSYRLFYPFMDSKPMDELVYRESTKWYDYPIHKWIRCSRFTDVALYRSCRGWLNYWESLSDGIISDDDWNRKRGKIQVSDKIVQVFRESIDLLTKNNCHVILVYPGIIQAYQDSDPETYNANIKYFQAMADENPHIDFLNYSPVFSHRQELFEDSVHINRQGEKIFTKLIIEDIQKIIEKKNIQF